jgi:biopolymer transport protein ExbD
MPPKILFRIGLTFFVVATAIYFSTGRWLDSRTFTPLRYSVSLDNRQLRPEPFEINLGETYFVSLGLDQVDYYEDNRCNYRTLYPQWRVYKLSSASAHSRELWVSSEQLTRSDGSLSNAFFASPGQYQLEWEISEAAPCLNPRHPRLVVFTDSFGYREDVRLAQLFCLFLGGAGLALFVVAGQHVARRRFSRTSSLRMFPDMVLRNVIPIAKHAPIRVIHELPHWGLFCGPVLWILIFMFMIFGPLPRKGLYVDWRNREPVVWEKSPWPETLGVYVSPGHFFINGEEVRQSELGSKLKEQLGRRVEWTVYFEADPDTMFMDDVYALDTIQGCGANVVWITPKMRAEWKHKLNE